MLCVVRAADGRWLAGRRAAWLASWAEPLGARARRFGRGRREPGRHAGPGAAEEWSVAPERLRVEALVRLPSGLVLLVGQAWLAEGATVTPDAEHDDFAWWPADVDPVAGARPTSRCAGWPSAARLDGRCMTA